MRRRYGRLKVIETEVVAMKEAGKTKREIAENFGVDFLQIKELLKRYNRGKRQTELGNPPKKRGRPRVGGDAQLDKDARIAQLEMENELLRDFLAFTGRG